MNDERDMHYDTSDLAEEGIFINGNAPDAAKFMRFFRNSVPVRHKPKPKKRIINNKLANHVRNEAE